jgi:hypothetical protein
MVVARTRCVKPCVTFAPASAGSQRRGRAASSLDLDRTPDRSPRRDEWVSVETATQAVYPAQPSHGLGPALRPRGHSEVQAEASQNRRDAAGRVRCLH